MKKFKPKDLRQPGDIDVTMTRAAYDYYMRPRKDHGGGLRSKEELVRYLNETGIYRGRVVDVHVDENILRNPHVEEE